MRDPDLLDRATLAYAAFAAGVIVARGASPTLPLLLTHLAVAVVALIAPRLRPERGVAAFLATLYPLMAMAGLYTAVGLANAGRSAHDAAVQAWDAALFAGQPSRDWIRAWPHPALSWTLHGAYLGYYAVVAVPPLALWFAGRREGARRLVLAVSLAYYACYAVFLVFPVAGPRYLFPPALNAATEVLPARLAQRLLEQAAAWGTAFPSSHVAAALAAAGAAWREWPTLGAALLPVAGLLAAGTVYGQFHYAADALAGVLVAAAVLAAAPRGD